MSEKKMSESLGAPTNRADSILNKGKKTLGPRLYRNFLKVQDFNPGLLTLNLNKSGIVLCF